MMISSSAAMGIAFFTSVASCCWAAAYAWVKWLQHSRGRHAGDPELKDRLERIDHAIDAMAIEMERLGEGQRFVTRLLAETSPNAKVARGVESHRVITPH
jgi:hypothetical protein